MVNKRQTPVRVGQAGLSEPLKVIRVNAVCRKTTQNIESISVGCLYWTMGRNLPRASYLKVGASLQL